jgi:hypothetical protein
MRKNAIFILIFFLVFILNFKLSLGTQQCSCGFDTFTGECFECEHYIPPPETVPPEVPQIFQETQTASQRITSQLISLIFQFFGMVILFVILVLLLQTVIEI